jgi:hypothetical protein
MPAAELLAEAMELVETPDETEDVTPGTVETPDETQDITPETVETVEETHDMTPTAENPAAPSTPNEEGAVD